ncbi:glycosyltransferase family 2 protein [Paramagnetospirillum magneticum]|uniref:Predicted glycosyltransferase n=1 Tax=Paramagnetospirillum magneticum (strain ATCC 700264 / AMB-1) TaxID=342108 RepID=Q2W8E7_PARM1|nr:glycosyltransferase family 2 protein [Paramagnetospirillum magneticum]BAE49878.1 Predicted glycosyltransferase [Paramagnetospirillum magneticum AMB-1]
MLMNPPPADSRLRPRRPFLLPDVGPRRVKPPASIQPAVSVLIVTYNSAAHIRQCLECLREQTYEDFEVLVVDCASADGSHGVAVKAADGDTRFHFLPQGRNLGFAAGNNLAARAARGRWLACLNPDAFAEPDWLQQLMDATIRYPFADMFGSTQFDAGNPALLDGCGDLYHAVGLAWRAGHGGPISSLPRDREVFSPCAAASLYRADGFNSLGGFDERFFCFMEDVDLAFRWRLTGGRCIQVRNAAVHHVGGASAGRTSAFARYHGLRNALWCFAKNMPTPLLACLLLPHLALLAALVARDIRRGQGKAAVRAVRDGLLGLRAVLADRAVVQRRRTLAVIDLSRKFTWSLRALWRREAP